MRADTLNGIPTLRFSPYEDPEYKRLVERVRELNEELDKALGELLYYSQEFELAYAITVASPTKEE